jgi:hypothetical protein
LFYSIDKTTERQVSDDLAERRRTVGAGRVSAGADVPIPSPAAAPAVP